MSSKKLKIISTLVFLVLIISGAFIFLQTRNDFDEIIIEENNILNEKITQSQIIGKSTEGRDIEIYSFGGESNLIQNLADNNFSTIDEKRLKPNTPNIKNLLFVGGIHGGYEYNSVELAYEMINFYTANLNQIPDNVNITSYPF